MPSPIQPEDVPQPVPVPKPVRVPLAAEDAKLNHGLKIPAELLQPFGKGPVPLWAFDASRFKTMLVVTEVLAAGNRLF